MNQIPPTVPVLVAGAGPAGLITAIALARANVRTLLVERRAAPSDLPRATVVSLRSMELLRAWGLEDPVRAGAVDVSWRLRDVPTLARAAEGVDVEVGVPTPEQSAMVSPTAPACVPQDHLERVLRDHLRGLPAATLLTGTAVAGVEPLDGGACVRLRAADGEERDVAAQYVVGADGAHSAVRRAAGIAMRGPDDLRRVVTVLFRAPLWPVVGPHRHGIYAVGGETVLPAGGDRWLWGRDWAGDRAAAEAWPPEERIAAIRAAAGVPDLPVQLERVGVFTFAAQLADRFRAGRVLLAGDAAHRVTPRGGTGMNLAIRDGLELGWRLAWVVRGWADDALLDGYEAERRPVAEHVVARSADPNGSVRAAADELHADVGTRVAHAWVGPGRSTLDALGPGLTLFLGPDAHADVPAPGGPPVAVRRLDAAGARRLGLHGGGALLCRPDGTPAGLWPGQPVSETAIRLSTRSPEPRSWRRRPFSPRPVPSTLVTVAVPR